MAVERPIISIAKHQHDRRGARQIPESAAWSAMKQRCLFKNSADYHRYGGRGIKICDRWLNGEDDASGLQCFIADMGRKPSAKHTLDRRDNDGNYEPSNCRWATPKEQAHNRATNVRVAIDGAERTITEWAEIYGIRRNLIFNRIRNGWQPLAAITTPVVRPTEFLTINGVTKLIKEWGRESGINPRTIGGRIDLGWPPEEVLQPVGARRRQGRPQSEATKAKLSATKLGKPSNRKGMKVSAASLERMRLAQRARHAKRK